jgi:hypothetical protein
VLPYTKSATTGPQATSPIYVQGWPVRPPTLPELFLNRRPSLCRRGTIPGRMAAASLTDAVWSSHMPPVETRPNRTRQRAGLKLELSTNRPLGTTRRDRVSRLKLMAHSPTASLTLVRLRSSGSMTQRRTGNDSMTTYGRMMPLGVACI